MAAAGGKNPEKLGEALATAEELLAGRSREGAGARLRLGANRRRRLRSLGDDRAAARHRREGGTRRRARAAAELITEEDAGARRRRPAADAARRAGRAGARDRGFVDALQRGRRRARSRASTSASPRASRRRRRGGRRAGRRTPVVELSRVVERSEGVTPPRQRPPRRTPRSVVYRRRLAALALLVAAIAAVWFIVAGVKGGDGTKTQPTVPAAAEAVPDRLPGRLHAGGDGPAGRAVAKIAQKEARDVTPRLTAAAYLPRRAAALHPGLRDASAPLEGFLFPAKYAFSGARPRAVRRSASCRPSSATGRS